MPYKDIEKDQADLIAYARGGAPKAVVTELKPPQEPTVHDEILDVLKGLVADIEGGKVLPSHLIIGLGEYNEDDTMTYWWDTVGLNVFETIGFLQMYATKLANGEGA
jgi:hypothetical protein